MRIRSVSIHNYRSAAHLTFNCVPMMVFLGPNNHGKSTLLSALDFFHSPRVKCGADDFCAFMNEDQLWVEIEYEDLSDQESTTFSRYVRPDATIKLRKWAEHGGKCGYHGYIQEAPEPWLSDSSISELCRRDNIGSTPLAKHVPASGRLTKEMVRKAQEEYQRINADRLVFEEKLEEGPLLGQKNVAAGVLPDFFLVPAVKDLADETRIKSTTTFGRLLTRAVQEMAESDESFASLRERMEELVGNLNRRDEADVRPRPLRDLEADIRSELADWDVDVEIEVLPPLIDKIFEMGTSIHLHDGVKTSAHRKGHGLQRAVIFALLRAWGKAVEGSRGGSRPRASSDSVFFAIEEPELFLHPHAQRRLARSMRELANKPNHQLFACSHSSHFVNLTEYRELAIVRKLPRQGTTVKQCISEIFEGGEAADRKRRFQMAHWINPDRGEMFFAKLVVFVEGDTERVMIPYLGDKLGYETSDVSVIDVGSKHNFPLYINVANSFDLDYLVIHDEDPVPDPIPSEWSNEKAKEKRRTFDLNREILRMAGDRAMMLRGDFESVAGIPRSQGKKKGKPVAALDAYHDRDPDSFPDRLRQLIHRVYGQGNRYTARF